MKAITGDKLRGHLETMVLSVLERGDTHGMEIIRRLEEAGCGLLRLKEGSLYPALYRLEAAGMVVVIREAQRNADEQATLDDTKKRFGNPRELSAELQKAVPGWDRVGYWIDKMQYQPGESLLHFLGKHLLITFTAYCIMLLIPLAISITSQRPQEYGLMACVLAIISVLGSGSVMLVELFGAGMRRAFGEEDAGWSYRLSAIYALATLPILPAFAFVAYWALTGDLGAAFFISVSPATSSLRHRCSLSSRLEKEPRKCAMRANGPALKSGSRV